MCLDRYFKPGWFDSSLSYHIFHIFPFDESIMEVRPLCETPWEYYHHRSSFLPKSPSTQKSLIFKIDECSQSHYYAQYSEGNFINITPTMFIIILDKLGTMKNNFYWLELYS